MVISRVRGFWDEDYIPPPDFSRSNPLPPMPILHTDGGIVTFISFFLIYICGDEFILRQITDVDLDLPCLVLHSRSSESTFSPW